MALEPTRTKTLRNRWLKDFTRRFRMVHRDVNRWLFDASFRANPTFTPFVTSTTVTNVRHEPYQFTSDPQSIVNFMLFLQTRIDNYVLSVNRASTGQLTGYSGWMVKYANNAYLRGIKASQAQLRALGVPLALLLDQAEVAQLAGGIVPQLAVTDTANQTVLVTRTYVLAPVMVKPIHLEALRIAYTRDFTDLQGITDAMSQQIRREITLGMEAALPTREIAKNINNRIDKIGLTRAKTLARTEVGRSFRLASINDAESMAEEIGLDIDWHYLWDTAQDERVRSSHARRHGRIFTREEVLLLIGDPNCRCATPAVLPEFENRKDRKKAAKERRELLAKLGEAPRVSLIQLA